MDGGGGMGGRWCVCVCVCVLGWGGGSRGRGDGADLLLLKLVRVGHELFLLVERRAVCRQRLARLLQLGLLAMGY